MSVLDRSLQQQRTVPVDHHPGAPGRPIRDRSAPKGTDEGPIRNNTVPALSRTTPTKTPAQGQQGPIFPTTTLTRTCMRMTDQSQKPRDRSLPSLHPLAVTP